MSLRDELKDPWGWVVAGTIGGVGAVSGPGIVAGLAIGAAVLGTKVLIGAATHREPASYEQRRRPDALPTPPPGSAAAQLLNRAQIAVQRLRQLAATPGDPWLADQVGEVDDQAAQAYSSLFEVGGRVTLVEQSMAGNDPAQLASESARMRARAEAASDPRLRTETERGADAIEQQRVVAQRLVTLHATLITRMQTAVVGLEGLAARMGEVVALGPLAVEHDRASSLVADLTTELDTLRSGLDETAALDLPVVAQRLTEPPPVIGGTLSP